MNDNDEMMDCSDANSTLKDEFINLCKISDIHTDLIEDTWFNYNKLKQAFSLEGEQLHWLLCVLYIFHQREQTLSISENETTRLLSLTKLLRSFKINFKTFLTKVHKIYDIYSFPKDSRYNINKIEQEYNVIAVIYEKYKEIYLELFTSPFQPTSQTKNLFQSVDLFKFCWLLFIYVKEKFPAISNDLVNLYHLLICCFNLIYINLIAANRYDLLLLNEKYKLNYEAIKQEIEKQNNETNQLINICIDDLCKKNELTQIETKTIYQHYFKPHLKCLANRKILKCTINTFTDILECDGSTNNFCENCVSLNQVYDEYVLNSGRIDERVFLKSIPDSQYFTYRVENLFFDNNKPKREKALNEQKSQTENFNMLTEKSQNHAELSTLLRNAKAEPSENLLRILKDIEQQQAPQTETYIEFIQNYVNCTLTQLFVNKYSNENTNTNLSQSLCIYYKTLELLLLNEKKRYTDNNFQNYLNIDCLHKELTKFNELNFYKIKSLLKREVFHKALFACCVEIVICFYSPEKLFPWILSVFDLHAYDFLKIIELFIRADECLPRFIIKHLNTIEKKILESDAWKANSPLWTAIQEQHNNRAPVFDEATVYYNWLFWFKVCLSSSVSQSSISSDLIINLTPNPVTSHASSSTVTNSPVKHPAITRVVCASNGGSITSSGGDSRFYSPNKKTETIITQTSLTQISKVSSPSNHSFIMTPNTRRQLFTTTISTTQAIPVQHHSIITSTRILEFIERLELSDQIGKRIWNIFEYSIVNHVDLMRDRHLDQILMSAIYVTSKISSSNLQFQEIMKAYRLKIQMNNSQVYRDVLIQKFDANDPHEVRGDIIQFYNEIYIKTMKAYVKHYINGENKATPNLTLSPIPKIGMQTFSPRRIADSQSVFVSPGKQQIQVQRPKITWSFSKSLNQDLNSINEMIKRNEIRIKSSNKRRLLSDSELDDEVDSNINNPEATTTPTNKSTTMITTAPSQNTTKIITLNSGYHFTKKLQTLKNDRLNAITTVTAVPSVTTLNHNSIASDAMMQLP